MDMKLKGKVALVTGAASGIGRQTCIQFAEEGANVIIADIQDDLGKKVAEECKKKGVDALYVHCDMLNLPSISAAVKSALDKFKRIDIVVCGAGILKDNMIHKMTEQEWDLVLGTHLKGHWWLLHDVVPQMKENKYGRIVLIASTALRGTRGQANYSCAKAAMVGLAKTLSYELSYLGISANVVAPGLVHTPLTDAFIMNEKASKPMIDSILMKRQPEIGPLFGTPEDIANAIVFLSSDRASYITGEVLLVAGGRMM